MMRSFRWQLLLLSASLSSISAFQTRFDRDNAALALPEPGHILDTALSLFRRADCTTVQVKSGDSCSSLASECGISDTKFTEYNNKTTLCSTLQVGQYVCCSSGTLPDLAPKKQANGTCATYKVKTGDTCSAIAAANSITESDIKTWNELTWQFTGCDDIQVGQVICLSSGDPPMPAAVSGAICGPQVPGTQKPDNMSTPGALASLNPCPLKVCCDIWGQCGNTAEFCTVSNSSTGAPGTAAPGQNGCISNCGTKVVSSAAPASPYTVGYFEGFNLERPCLHMEASQIPTSTYTHLHFAFGNITAGYDIQLTGSSLTQWDDFRKLSGPKRIISFGGWAFSTSPSTYQIFRQGVTAANRATLIKSLTSFVSDQDIDGVDFDWEYPGEPDIPGIPAGSPSNGEDYLAFLTELRDALPSGKTISIAAPASYWYLREFPIAEMSKVVDYIVFMTYDLHGQWDYGNNSSDSGCPAGNCLRSDVNLTETMTALSMITKAGVPSNKVVVGVTSYGRSFKMTEAGCTGPMCTYTGPKSGALPGKCTQTAGYLAQAEILNILATDSSASTFHDGSASDSDILVYNQTQWASYMSNATKSSRRETYLGLNFLGTVDWAIDLSGSLAAKNTTNSTDLGPVVDVTPLPDCPNADKYHTVDAVIKDTSISKYCVNMYLLNALAVTMEKALANYTDIMNDGYQSKYDAYAAEVRVEGGNSWQTVWSKEMNTYWHCLATESGKNVSVECAPNGPLVGSEFYFELKDKKKWCHVLNSTYNLECSWVGMNSGKYVPHSSECVPGHSNCEATGTVYWPDFNHDFPVPNPANLITKALANYTAFSGWLSDSAFTSQLELFIAQNADAVDAASLPVFMVESAVKAMNKVAKLGAKIEEEERKEMILSFLTAFLLLIPGLGDLADGIEALEWVVRAARLTGVAGNAGLSIYGAVENPKSAGMAVVSILLDAAALRDDTVWSKAATEERTVSDDFIDSLGEDVSSNMNKVRKECNACNP